MFKSSEQSFCLFERTCDLDETLDPDSPDYEPPKML